MGNIKTIVIGAGCFIAGYGTKCLIDYFVAKKVASTDDKEEEAAE